MSRLVDMTGERYGKLSVRERMCSTYYGTKGRLYTNWKCLCDCGNYTVVTRMNLVSGNAKSCGCLRKFKAGEASFNRLYGQYKNNAKKRSYDFLLTKDDFKDIILKDCYYCGKKPEMIQKATIRNNGDFKYNGVDRVDNTIGYKINNCVAACKECNLGKGSKSKEEFLSWVRRVYENNG